MQFSGLREFVARRDGLGPPSFADKPDFDLAGLRDIILPSSSNGLVEKKLICLDIDRDSCDDILLLYLEADFRRLRVFRGVGRRWTG